MHRVDRTQALEMSERATSYLSSGWRRFELGANLEQAREHGFPACPRRQRAAAEASKAGRQGAAGGGVRELVSRLGRSGLKRDRRRRSLGPTIVALTEGIDVALANKEAS